MIVFSNTITHRLQYAADFISRQITGKPCTVTNDQQVFADAYGYRINYSETAISNFEYRIHPHSLLFETNIQPQAITCFDWNGDKAFFQTGGELPFDIFAATFYLLSRFEEYLPHEKDLYGRYAHQNSLAFKEGFLDVPLVNKWIRKLGEELRKRFPEFPVQPPSFSFLPTYDIDEACSFKHKGWRRIAGAAIKDLLLCRFNRFALRRKVLNNEVADPFDSYDWLHDLHRPQSLKPRYFFLVPEKTGKYDRNILPSETALQTLIRQHAEKYPVGVHPSWQSGDHPGLIKKEIKTIEKITQQKVIASRQHFIRFNLPDTYRRLIEAGIKEDFSMGYGSINGFRASVASPFYWFDLERNESTGLLVYPFCYMEANSYYEQKQTPQQALNEMRHYYKEVKSVDGVLVTIWHNTFLGTDEKFDGWRDTYAAFFNEVATT